MGMKEWAKHEVELACKKENPDWDGKSFDYGCSCYGSALKAYESLCEDGHSGFSFSATRSILKKLLYEIPLTPIEDKEDEWSECKGFSKKGIAKTFQNCRRSSLFKDVDEYGCVTYNDNDRVVCYEIGSKHGCGFGVATKVIDEMYPITMPYTPDEKPYKVYFETFLSDKNNGDYDMAAIFYTITPSGRQEEIHRFFDLRGEEPKEISKDEYFYIKMHSGEN